MNAHTKFDAAARAAAQIATEIASGAEIDIPLDRLKASPRNARKVPHTSEAIEALAASIAAKRMLQKPVVEPERDAQGAMTGYWLVTIGEGRRQALKLLAKRKVIKKSYPVSCMIEVDLDAQEISLDENITRSAMHPADQFEAFRDQAERRGLGAEEIAARFGVSAHVVRQRLRLGAVSPRLLAIYREDGLTLDQLMAFAVSEDHARQEQVFECLSYNRSAHFIRSAMTETKVEVRDRRARFVGLEAYAQAGGTILRDLFTEDGGGWLEDVGLLDRLVAEKLAGLAIDIRNHEGWKWAEGHLDYPHAHGFSRVYAYAVERSDEDKARLAALSEEYDALVDQWDSVEELPPEIEARFAEIDAALKAAGDSFAYDPDDLARSGVFVVLGHDGAPRIERGLIRPEDQAPQPEDEAAEVEHGRDGEGDDADNGGGGAADSDREDDEPAEGAGAPLPDRLVQDLTAHKTCALRVVLGEHPTLALSAVTHALALSAFYPLYERASCLEIKATSAPLSGQAPGIEDSPAGLVLAARHTAWGQRIPRDVAALWSFVETLDGDELLALLAHCAGLSLNAVRSPFDRRPMALTQAEALAQATGLDMNVYWQADAASYLSRVTKARIVAAVSEGVSVEAAQRLEGLKKPEMVAAAEEALAGTGWLPPLLRTEPASSGAGDEGSGPPATE